MLARKRHDARKKGRSEMRQRALLVLTTMVLTLAMANGTAMAIEVEDGISLPPEFPGQINNCSGLARICLPTGDITLKADNTSGICTWTYNIAWGDGGTSSFVSRPGITESASHKYVHPGIYTIDVTIPPGTSSDPARPNVCGSLTQRYVVEVPDYRPDTFIGDSPAPSPGSTVPSREATFTYTSNMDHVTFECSLDGSPFSDCPSEGQDYSDLADGQHTFQVRARDAGGNEDLSPATRTWTVDFPEPPPPPPVIPHVTGTDPDNGDTGVARTVEPTARFDADLDSASVNARSVKLQLYSAKKKRWVAVSSIPSYSDKVVTVNTANALGSRKMYRVVLTTGIESTTDDNLEQAYKFRFNTRR
jgi:hypothetical protein